MVRNTPSLLFRRIYRGGIVLISVSNHNQNFEPVSIETMEDLAQHMLGFNYSFGVFKNNNRTNEHKAQFFLFIFIIILPSIK